jgi:hypothetical protein
MPQAMNFSLLEMGVSRSVVVRFDARTIAESV